MAKAVSSLAANAKIDELYIFSDLFGQDVNGKGCELHSC